MISKLATWAGRAISILVACVATIMLVRAFDSRGLPELMPWHTTILEAEFRADDADEVDSLEAYLALEERLFEELSARIEAPAEAGHAARVSRFARSSESHPSRFDRNWNRSYELLPEAPKGAALLLHGLTDSPYSLRSLAQLLYEQGYYVLSPRMPGHGTNPGALLNVEVEDWRAVTRLAARHVRDVVGPTKPMVVVGYSKGGALAVDYTISALEDEALPTPDRLILLSPAIGVSPAGIVGSWHKALSGFRYFEKFAWLDIFPEYDPFKFNSFPKNAGRQMYLLTQDVAAGLERARDQGLLDRFPPTLSLQSVADTTVSTAAVLDPLYRALDSPRHALVLFDVNTMTLMNGFLDPSCDSLVRDLETAKKPAYRLSLLTNVDEDTLRVEERELGAPTDAAGGSGQVFEWPSNVYSLSHVAIPFPPNDLLYGAVSKRPDLRRLQLGRLAPRGEKGLLSVSMNNVMRLRHNPFYDYVIERIRAWLPAGPGAEQPSS